MNGNALDIRGGGVNWGTGIFLGGGTANDYLYAVELGSEAFIKSFVATGQSLNAWGSKVVNAGDIQGYDGVVMSGINNTSSSYLINSGAIKGDTTGIMRSSSATETLFLENTGTISGSSAFYAPSGTNWTSVENITNKGKMIGNIPPWHRRGPL